MSAVTFSGANGIDFGVILNAVMAQERLPLTTMEAQKTVLKTQSTAFASLATKLGALESAADALTRDSSFGARMATTTDSSVVTASADAGAVAGIYDIKVNALARAQVTASSSRHADTDTTVVATGGSLTIGGTAVTLTGDVTLKGLANAINSTDDISVTATIVRATDGYQLVLTGKETGLDNAFTITNQLTGGTVTFTDTDADGVSGDSAADNAMQASNASITVNNVSVTSATNTIADAIPGTTLTLLRQMPDDTVTVSVTEDAGNTESMVTAFVNAYNALVTFAQQQNGTAGIARDPLFRGLRNGLRTILADTYDAGGSLKSLGQAGIEFDRTGTLTINTALFQETLSASPSALRDLFMGDGVNDGVFSTITSTIEQYTDAGALLSSLRNRLDEQSSAMDDRLAAMEERLENRRLALQREYTAADMIIGQLNSQAGSLSSLSNSLF
ncbi:MAG: flagellar filament capping protein FliD [Vicinamibacterales bacterium]|nr:flagellar filament capping protein FliD [Vicinamibacterales bacterium]